MIRHFRNQTLGEINYLLMRLLISVFMVLKPFPIVVLVQVGQERKGFLHWINVLDRL